MVNIYRFGNFVFESGRGLFRAGKAIDLPPRVNSLLLCLVTAGGEYVDRQALLRSISADGKTSAASMWRAVHLLRQALGDKRCDLVKTSYGRGVRLTLPISVSASSLNAVTSTDVASRTFRVASGEEMIRTAFELASGRTERNLQLAHSVLASALERFPSLALAASLQADIDVARMIRGYVKPISLLPKALASIDQAFRIQPRFPAALATKGWLTGAITGDRPGGLRLIDMSLAASPNGWMALFYKAWLLIGERDLGAARLALETALTVAPLERSLVATMAWLLAVEGRFGEALEYIREVASLRPDVELLWIVEAIVRVRQGDLVLARESMAKAAALCPGDSFTRATSAWVDAVTGHATDAVAYMAHRTRGSGGYTPPVLRAMVRHALGDDVGAENLLKIAEADRDPWRLWAWCDPRLTMLPPKIASR